LIASLGLRLTHAFNADEALKTLRAPDHAEDSGFLLTDLVMPGAMDCVALALKVRAERPGLPLTDLWLRLGLS
jgi:CheY-like chemotaxis protein